jgi:UDP-glucuronate 4-epimerase
MGLNAGTGPPSSHPTHPMWCLESVAPHVGWRLTVPASLHTERKQTMQKVLITGGAGFIGSRLGASLLEAGQGIRVLDNLDTFYDPAIKRRNLAMLQSRGGDRIEFVEGDIRDRRTCRAVLDGCDAVVHLAALAGVRPSIAAPTRYMDVNVTGTQTLLDSVQDPGLHFVFGSSSSVYGGNTKVPFSEADIVDQPVSPYAASKKAGELLCHAFHHLRGNPVTCLRFFTVYGPGQRPEMAIHKFARHIQAGVPLPFYGNGQSRRDYTYVSDIVDGITAAMNKPNGFSIYNLGGAATTTLADLVSLLEHHLERPAVLDMQADQAGDVPCTYADVSRAREQLGYEPKVSIEDGLGRFCHWFQQQNSRDARVAWQLSAEAVAPPA